MLGSSLSPEFLYEDSCLIYVLCVCLRIVVSCTYFVLFLFSSSCVPYVSCFSGLSIFDCPFGIYIYISTFSSIRSFHILIDDFLFFVAPFTFCFVLDKTIQFVTQNYKLATFLTNISFNRVFKFFITNDSVECGNNQYLDAWNFRNRTRIKMLQ